VILALLLLIKLFPGKHCKQAFCSSHLAHPGKHWTHCLLVVLFDLGKKDPAGHELTQESLKRVKLLLQASHLLAF